MTLVDKIAISAFFGGAIICSIGVIMMHLSFQSIWEEIGTWIAVLGLVLLLLPFLYVVGYYGIVQTFIWIWS